MKLPHHVLARQDSLVVLIGIGCLLAIAVALLTLAPLLLMRGQWRVRRPRLALAIWHTLLASAAGCIVATLVWTLLLVTTGTHHSSAAWLQPTALMLFGWVGLAGLGGAAAMVFAHAEPMAETDRRLQTEFALLASRSQSYEHRGIDVAVVSSSVPVALSVPGSSPLIVIASTLAEALTDEQLRAVIEHEHAHLVQHHGLVTRLAQLNRSCLAFLPSSQELEGSTRMLIELIADDAAARHAGAVHLANALLKIGTMTGDEAMVLRARRIAARPPRGSLTSSRRLRRTAATVSAQS